MKQKADELGRPVTLMVDPVKEVVVKWLDNKASKVVGGWDRIHYGNYYKKFYPNKK